jgi:hypothetical protein
MVKFVPTEEFIRTLRCNSVEVMIARPDLYTAKTVEEEFGEEAMRAWQDIADAKTRFRRVALKAISP